MEQDFVNKTYDRIDFKENPLVKGDYEGCKFTSCDLSNTDLSEIKFIDCEFISCNLSLAKLSKTVFRDIQFVNCKIKEPSARQFIKTGSHRNGDPGNSFIFHVSYPTHFLLRNQCPRLMRLR